MEKLRLRQVRVADPEPRLVEGSENFLAGSVADPDPGSGAFLTPGSGMGKNQDPDPGHVSESLETIFWVKILKFFYEDPGSGMKKFGSGNEKIRIRDRKYSDPG